MPVPTPMGRALLAGAAIPAWVLVADGLPADVALDEANNRYWVKGVGYVDPSTLRTVSRASTKYVTTSSGLLVPVASNVVARGDLGANVEESRANSIKNNSMTGAVVGTPGTLPNFWSIQTVAGITNSVVALGTENGLPYIDLRAVGTNTSGSIGFCAFFLMPGNTSGVPATSAQTWSFSPYIKLVGGSLTNLISLALGWNAFDSSGAYLNTNTGAGIAPSSSFVRYNYTAAPSNASTAYIHPIISFQIANATAVDFTFRIYAPQLELGSFATSPIPTTTAAATRAADVVTGLGAVATASQRPSGGAVIMEMQLIGRPSSTRRLLSIGKATGGSFYDEEINLYVASDGTLSGEINSGGQYQAGLNGTLAAGSVDKIGVSWGAAPANRSVFHAGSRAAISGFNLPATVDLTRLGSDRDGNSVASILARRIFIWANPISISAGQALTA